MHRSFSIAQTRWAASVGVGLALAISVLAAGCGEDAPPSDPGSNGGGTTSGGGGTPSGAGSGTGGAGASAGGTAGVAGTAGTGKGGQAGAGAAGASGAGGTPASGAGGGGNGGTPSAGGAGAGATGGAGAGSGGAGAAGLGGSGGASAGGGAGGTAGEGAGPCPSGVTGTPALSGTPMRVSSVPPPDAFNMNNGTWGNIEGPVWIDGALYVSEMTSESYDQQNGDVKKARILKVTPAGETSIFIADSGTNGLAVDAAGDMVAGVHKDGSITRFSMPDGAPTAVVSMFMGARFNSPNDLVIHSNGTIYFSDPNFQAPSTRPQAATRVYRVPLGGQAEPIPNASAPDTFNNPNGVTLSLDEDYLYVAASNGRRYPVMSDGSLGAGENYEPVSGADGLAVDCAGNLYVAAANAPNVRVYEPDGTPIGQITVDVQGVTNVAFGGPDRKTLYITGLGNNKGLFQLALDIPGRPY